MDSDRLHGKQRCSLVSPVWWLQISCCISLQHSYSRDGTTLCCVGRLEFCKQRGASAAHCISFGRQLCHCVAWSMELPERPRLQSINGLVLSNEFPCCAAFVQGNPRVEATWSLPLCCWKSILAASCSSSAPRRSEMGIGYWQWIFWRIRRDCARVRPKSLRSAATGTFPKRCTCLLHLFVWAIQIQCHGAGKRIAAPSRSTVIWPWKRNSRKRLKASYSLQTAFQTIVTIYYKNYCLSPCIFYIWWDQRRQSAGRLSKERRGAQDFHSQYNSL